MERKVVIVCAAVGFLGLLAAALGFAAEATRTKISDVQLSQSGDCLYPKSPALVLGLLATVALLIAQVITNTVAGCICCQSNTQSSGSNWTIALISFIASWVSFVLAFLLLLTGAALNDPRGQERMYYYQEVCYVVKPGVFAGGAVLSLASAALGIVYYAAILSSKNVQPRGPQHAQGIALGQPQIPPRTTTPVFVHEDSYNRQQFP